MDATEEQRQRAREYAAHGYVPGAGRKSAHRAALAAIIEADAREAKLRQEVERLRAENERLSKPNMFWDYEDCENGSDDLTVIMDAHELGFVARIQCAKTLPDIWAVGYITESGGFNARAFVTEEEAEAFAAEQRAALDVIAKAEGRANG